MKKGILLAIVLLAACGQPPQKATPPTLTVDTTLQPPKPNVPSFEDGVPRPIASVTGENGEQAEFVVNELWLSTDKESDLNAFLSRWQGKVVKSFKPADYGLSGLTNQYLVRVNVSSADKSKLGQDLQKLDPNATGSYKVSSQSGLELLSASASEAAAGAKVGLNWVGQGGQFRDQNSFEAPTGPKLAGVDYSTNAFSWPSHSRGSTQDIGVAQAWRALDLAGKLNNKVKLAVLDMGFKPDADFRPGWLAISNVPFVNPIGTENLIGCGDSDCPWHGTNVVSAAMAVPDNNYGSAGSAGPIADPVLIFTSYDFFTSITAIGEARIAGARIANMSYSAPVPWYLAWSVLPFELATKAFRETGMLLFASAGNEGKNVDSEGCTLGVCWERTWHTPCENAGVICVGGLAGNSTSRAGNSNYGDEQVDIFAPFTFWLGPDPSAPANAVQVINGTSFSSPFASGIAALIWAAKPSLSADGVEDILMGTAHKPGTQNVKRYVNALAAVQAALGNIPPSLGVPAGGEVPLNVALTYTADVFDFEDSFPCCTVRWVSNVDGTLSNTRQLSHTFTTTGPRTITVTATDSGGANVQASFNLNVVNFAPVASIFKPVTGTQVFQGSKLVLRGRATDRNEPQELLACNRLVWTSNVAGDFPNPLIGCEHEVSFATTVPRTLTLTATDPQGVSNTKQVSISVLTPPGNLPPFVNITNPKDFANIGRDETINLTASVSDPENATPLSFQWTVKVNNANPVVLGTTPSVQWKPSQSINFSNEGTYKVELRLNVTDPAGNTGTDFVTLEFLVIN